MGKVFVARQPILDARQRVIAYELLYRSGPQNVYFHLNGDAASQVVVNSTLHVFGLDDLARNQPVFVNFTRTLLIDGTALLVPPDRLIVEILETVEPDDQVIDACRDLKQRGYLLALDDYTGQPELEAFLPEVDVVKVDFFRLDDDELRALTKRLRARPLDLVAERIQTREEFAEAVALGYDLFQGFYFCEPEIVAREEVPGNVVSYLSLLREVAQPDVDLARLEQLIKQDVALPVKLLRYINSAWFGLHGRVESLRHAISLLGQRGLRQWVALTAVADLGRDRSPALTTTCLVRAAFCERLAIAAGIRDDRSIYFLTGLFSGLDALVGRPLDELLREVAVPDDVRAALQGTENEPARVLHLAVAYERGGWAEAEHLAGGLKLDTDVLKDAYVEAVSWSDAISAPAGGSPRPARQLVGRS